MEPNLRQESCLGSQLQIAGCSVHLQFPTLWSLWRHPPGMPNPAPHPGQFKCPISADISTVICFLLWAPIALCAIKALVFTVQPTSSVQETHNGQMCIFHCLIAMIKMY